MVNASGLGWIQIGKRNRQKSQQSFLAFSCLVHGTSCVPFHTTFWSCSIHLFGDAFVLISAVNLLQQRVWCYIYNMLSYIRYEMDGARWNSMLAENHIFARLFQQYALCVWEYLRISKHPTYLIRTSKSAWLLKMSVALYTIYSVWLIIIDNTNGCFWFEHMLFQ